MIAPEEVAGPSTAKLEPSGTVIFVGKGPLPGCSRSYKCQFSSIFAFNFTCVFSSGLSVLPFASDSIVHETGFCAAETAGKTKISKPKNNKNFNFMADSIFFLQ